MKFLEKWKGHIFKFFALVLGLFGLSTLLSAKKSKEVKEAKKEEVKKVKKVKGQSFNEKYNSLFDIFKKAKK